jgi:hypothetical protein
MTNCGPRASDRRSLHLGFGRLAGRTAASLLLVGALGLTVGAVSPAAAAGTGARPGPVVRGELLPVPVTGPGQQLTVTAADVSPLGVVAGTVRVTTTSPDGTQSVSDAPQRWARIPRVGWLRQRLELPAGATSGTVSGLTDLGEPAGAVTVDGTSRAARWSVDGRSATLIGGAGSRVSAVGPNGPWGVFTAGTEPIGITGEAELVTPAGARTPVRGTPELDAGYRRTVSSIAGPDVALAWVVDGIGRGTNARPVLWQAGATARLPVTSYPFLERACASRVRADGSVVVSGYTVEAGTPSFVLIRHVGGVPGSDVVLARAGGPGQPTGGLTCGPAQISNTLAADGGIAGYVAGADGRHAAYWNAANLATVVPRAAGEASAAGVAAAGGGRMVIQAEGDDGTTRLSLWRYGVRTQLPAPDGWTVTSVVELTDAGMLIANVRNAAGAERPAAWDLA